MSTNQIKEIMELCMRVQKDTFETLPSYYAENMMISYFDQLLEEEFIDQKTYVGLLEMNQAMFRLYEEE